MKIIFYIAVIVLANIITAAIPPIKMGYFIVPTGTLLVGVTFILRDFIQNDYGRGRTYQIIGIALILSAITSYVMGDTLYIVFASGVAFFLSEAIDTEIYTRLSLPMHKRVFWSGSVASLVDSSLFAIIGLSPIGAGFLGWNLIPYAIAGQTITKFLMQALGSLVLKFRVQLNN